MVSITWEVEDDEDGIKKFKDDHTHFVEYIHEEILTPTLIQSQVDETRAAVKQMIGDGLSKVAMNNILLEAGKYSNSQEQNNAE